MASKSIKVIAKFNALRLAETQLSLQCDAFDTLGELEGLPDGLLEEVNAELSKIVSSLRARAEKLDGKYATDLPDLVAESQI